MTSPGGYAHQEASSLEQFPIVDHRSLNEMERDLTALGFNLSMKDWQFEYNKGSDYGNPA
jgi:hypothetical protein